MWIETTEYDPCNHEALRLKELIFSKEVEGHSRNSRSKLTVESQSRDSKLHLKVKTQSRNSNLSHRAPKYSLLHSVGKGYPRRTNLASQHKQSTHTDTRTTAGEYNNTTLIRDSLLVMTAHATQHLSSQLKQPMDSDSGTTAGQHHSKSRIVHRNTHLLQSPCKGRQHPHRSSRRRKHTGSPPCEQDHH